MIFKKENELSVTSKIEFKAPIFEEELIDQFLEKNSYPIVFDFDIRASKKIFDEQKAALLLFYRQKKVLKQSI